MQAAVHECLGEAIGQHCRIVGQDSSDKEQSDSASEGCANSLWSDSDSDVHADAHEHNAGTAICIVGTTADCVPCYSYHRFALVNILSLHAA